MGVRSKWEEFEWKPQLPSCLVKSYSSIFIGLSYTWGLIYVPRCLSVRQWPCWDKTDVWWRYQLNINWWSIAQSKAMWQCNWCIFLIFIVIGRLVFYNKISEEIKSKFCCLLEAFRAQGSSSLFCILHFSELFSFSWELTIVFICYLLFCCNPKKIPTFLFSVLFPIFTFSLKSL